MTVRSLFLAELYAPDATTDFAEQAVARLRRSLGPVSVTDLVTATFVPGDGMLLCSIVAPSADHVVAGAVAAGIHFDRVSAALPIGEQR